MSDEASHHSRGALRKRVGKPPRDLDGLGRRLDGAPFALNRDHRGRLAGTAGRVGKMLRDHLLASERDHEDRANVGMVAVGGQRIVGDPHVGTELAAARRVRQSGAHRRDGRSHPLGNHRGTDHRRHDEHMITHADPPVSASIPPETWLVHRLGSPRCA